MFCTLTTLKTIRNVTVSTQTEMAELPSAVSTCDVQTEQLLWNFFVAYCADFFDTMSKH